MEARRERTWPIVDEPECPFRGGDGRWPILFIECMKAIESYLVAGGHDPDQYQWRLLLGLKGEIDHGGVVVVLVQFHEVCRSGWGA